MKIIQTLLAVAAPMLAGACMSDTDLVKNAEGFRACKYNDTKGIATICYGYNLQRSKAAGDLKSVGANLSTVMAGGCLSQSQCDSLLNIEMVSARNGARNVVGTTPCACANAVMVDMTYNLGSLSAFNTFTGLIKQGRWKDAAADGHTTLWCSQVGNRCSRDMNQILQC